MCAASKWLSRLQGIFAYKWNCRGIEQTIQANGKEKKNLRQLHLPLWKTSTAKDFHSLVFQWQPITQLLKKEIGRDYNKISSHLRSCDFVWRQNMRMSTWIRPKIGFGSGQEELFRITAVPYRRYALAGWAQGWTPLSRAFVRLIFIHAHFACKARELAISEEQAESGFEKWLQLDDGLNHRFIL